MPRLTHNTLESSIDQNGNTQRLCIQPRTSKSYSNVVTYKAWCHSYNKQRDPRHDKFVLAKFPSNVQATKEWACREQQRAKEIGEKALKFVTNLKHIISQSQFLDRSGTDITDNVGTSLQVKVLQPQSVSLDSVSFLDQTRQEGEFLIFEDKLENCQCFIDSEGRSVTSSKKRSGKDRGSTKRKSTKGKRSRSESLCDDAEQEEDATFQVLNTLSRISATDGNDENLSYRANIPEVRLPTYEESQAATLFGTHATGNHNFAPCDYHRPSRYEPSSQSYNPSVFFPPSAGVTPLAHNALPTCPIDSFEGSLPLQGRHRSDTETSSSSLNRDDDEEQSENAHEILHAFTHFYFSHTGGQSVIADLQGTFDSKNGYVLTTPTIHSLSQSFGERDEGVAGVKRVIDNHRCSKFCRHLPKMQEVFETVRMSSRGRNLSSGA